jgi:uncharacterized protein YndB with AHSA1/START domain
MEVIRMWSVVRSIEVKAPPSTVWPYVATEEGLRRWIDPSLDIDLEVGGHYALVGADGETKISGTVLDIVPEGALVLSWLEEGAGWLHPARLSILLSPTSEGTQVTIAHDGFAGIGKDSWRATLQAYERGAARHDLLARLARLVEASR